MVSMVIKLALAVFTFLPFLSGSFKVHSGLLHQRRKLMKPLTATTNLDESKEEKSWWQLLEDFFTPKTDSISLSLDTVPVVEVPAVVDPKEAVLVFGGTGRAGREIVQNLLSSNRQVVVAGRSEEKLKTTFENTHFVLSGTCRFSTYTTKNDT